MRGGITAVRGLNTILVKRYRYYPAKLAEWKAAHRIAVWPSSPSEPATTPGDGSGPTTPPAGS